MEKLTISDAGFDFTKLHTYSGYFVNNDKLLKSASGGAVTAIAEAIIKNGGIVFGASYSDDYKRSEYRCVDNIQDFERLKGSKYCDTIKEVMLNNKSVNVFSLLKEKINSGRLILFVGLGCDIGAVKSFCKSQNLDTSKLYTIDILCHGPTSAEVHKNYVEDLENKYNSKIKFFTVRYKKEGWMPPYIHAEFENGKIFEIPFYDSDYGFALNEYSKLSCYNCNFRGENHKSDITCGDFWGLTSSMTGWNENGVSIMFVRNARGEDLISMIDKTDYHIDEADTAFALSYNRMYFECRPKDKYYDKFGNDLKNNGLAYAVAHYPMSFKQKVKRLLKHILPKQVIIILKKIKSKL